MDRRWFLGLVGLVGLGMALVLVGPLQAGPPAPQEVGDAWLSGWVEIAPGETITLTHGLGGDPALYVVDLWFQDARLGGLGIHTRGLGGFEANGKQGGAFWQNLTASTVEVVRAADDAVISGVLVRIRVPEAPDYDSQWQALTPNALLTLTHGLGGDADDYVVDYKMEDQRASGRGTHNYALGGLEEGGLLRGHVWKRLNGDTVQIQRYANDVAGQRGRILIALPEEPAFDSGWVTVVKGAAMTLTHGLGGEIGRYAIDLSVKGRAAGRTNQASGGMFYGAQALGTYWQNLTSERISVVRLAQDLFADELRLRIWVAEPVTPCVPALLAPEDGAVLDNGRSDNTDTREWAFDWEDCPGATAYGLYVHNPSIPTVFLDRDDLTESALTYQDHAFTAEAFRFGWRWRVRAKVGDEWGPWSAERSFSVESPDTDPAPPCTPTLLSPAEGAVMDNGGQDEPKVWDFSWSACPGATEYNLYVIGATATSPLINSSGIVSPTYRLVNWGVVMGNNRIGWRWKVRAKIGGQWGAWSAERTFDVELERTDPPMCVPAPLMPESDAVLPNGTWAGHTVPCWEFAWEACPGADSYHLEIDDANGSYLRTDVLTGTTYTYYLPGYLAEEELAGWGWRVSARIDNIWGLSSDTRPFSVEPPHVPLGEPLCLPLILTVE